MKGLRFVDVKVSDDSQIESGRLAGIIHKYLISIFMLLLLCQIISFQKGWIIFSNIK
jgi:hypothetical protein